MPSRKDVFALELGLLPSDVDALNRDMNIYMTGTAGYLLSMLKKWVNMVGPNGNTLAVLTTALTNCSFNYIRGSFTKTELK